MSVCPVCNGLAVVQKSCPQCGRMMFDAGVIQDYYDGYSAYLEQELYEDGYRCYDHEICVHLIACPSCHFDLNIAFRRLEMEELTE